MAKHNELGALGEALAVEFLQKNKYKIVERNWRFKKAEIDIIAQKSGVLVVVEVKTRSSIAFGLPQDFVKPKKIQLLVRTSQPNNQKKASLPDRPHFYPKIPTVQNIQRKKKIQRCP